MPVGEWELRRRGEPAASRGRTYVRSTAPARWVSAALIAAGALSACADSTSADADARGAESPTASISSAPGPADDPFRSPAGPPAPCSEGFAADMPSDFEGEPSAAGALSSWLSGKDERTVTAPSPVPRDGWSQQPHPGPDDSATFVAGTWQATASQSTREQWLVTTLSCTEL
jgi:hypothetical protein